MVASRALCWLLLGVVTACASTDGDAEPASDPNCSGPDDHSSACIACRGEEDPVVGISRVGEDGVFAVELLESDPNPHVASLNTMLVRVTDASGDVVPDADFTRIEPFTRNPQGHGTSLFPEAAAGEQPGTYVLDKVNYVHSGAWTLTLDIEASDMSDTVQFLFCIADAPVGS